MKKIIRLTEGDLVRMVKRIVKESEFESGSPKKRSIEKIIRTTTSLDNLIRLLGGEDFIEHILNNYEPFGITDLRDLYDYKDWEDKDEFNIPDKQVRHNIPNKEVRHNIPNKEVNINYGNYKPQNKKVYSDEDNELINKINNLSDQDLRDISMNVRHDFDDVNQEELISGILNVFGKIKPSSVKKQKYNVEADLFVFNYNLDRATSKSFSAARGLQDYFIDNLQMFR
jgi:hypothetical protein